MRAPQPSGTNSPSSSSHAYPSGCAIESHERCATARVARGDPAALTGPYRPARERPARARPWRRGSPDPIPNSEVKPAIAESTAAPGCGRIGRRARGGCFCFVRASGLVWSGARMRLGGRRFKDCLVLSQSVSHLLPVDERRGGGCRDSGLSLTEARHIMSENGIIDPVSPGELLKEEFLEPLGISQYRLAKEIGVPAQPPRRHRRHRPAPLSLLRSVRRLLAPRPGCLRHRDGASQAGPRTGEDPALERRGLSVMHDARF